MHAADTRSPDLIAAAKAALAYLAATDPLPATPCDAVIGFGVFDLRLPRFCAELYERGLARRVIFTGGIGAGTGELGAAEADVWRDVVRESHPGLPAEAIVLENRSTNTAENITFTADLLRNRHPEWAFGSGICHAIIVASPSRLRRVRLTLQHLQPQVRVFRALPEVNFAAEEALYAQHGINYLAHLFGELDRLVTYPARGWIAAEPLPLDIQHAHAMLAARTTAQMRP